MKLYSTIRVDMTEQDVLERPGLFARLRRVLGGNPDLSTGTVRAALEAATLVDAHRRALAEVGATDAVALVVDDLVLFQDRDRRPDDLGDMFLTFHEYAPAIDAEFRTLRLTVEHREAGLHYVIELQARPEYPKGEAPVRVIVSGRIELFEPRLGETAESYRARVAPHLEDPVLPRVAQAAFDNLVTRVRDAIARWIPDAHATVVSADTATKKRATRREGEQRPDDPNYDPHEAHYPNPMFGMFGMAMLGMAMMPAFGDAPAEPGSNPSESDPPSDDGGAFFDGDW